MVILLLVPISITNLSILNEDKIQQNNLSSRLLEEDVNYETKDSTVV
jgi:hypothetical protein